MEADSFLSPNVSDFIQREKVWSCDSLKKNPGNQECVIFTKQPLLMNLRFRST